MLPRYIHTHSLTLFVFAIPFLTSLSLSSIILLLYLSHSLASLPLCPSPCSLPPVPPTLLSQPLYLPIYLSLFQPRCIPIYLISISLPSKYRPLSAPLSPYVAPLSPVCIFPSLNPLCITLSLLSISHLSNTASLSTTESMESTKSTRYITEAGNFCSNYWIPRLIGKRKMCSFGSCQTRFEFLSQFRKVRNAFECFVTQVQTCLPKTKCVWPMKINVICSVAIHFISSCLIK